MIAEWILTRFSREVDLPSGGASSKDPLKVLRREYPDLEKWVSGKSVLDFGCGHGEQSAKLADVYGSKVTGLDNNPDTLKTATAKNGGKVRFIEKLSEDERYDVVISQNSMEHFSQPAAVLEQMTRVLSNDGIILITFGPPWYAPYGSHMHFFCRIPWLNILFPERAVMAVRARYRSDGARRYEEVESGLNRMSLRKFERLLAASRLQVLRRHYTALKGLNFLTKVPLVRELCTVHATVVVKKTA